MRKRMRELKDSVLNFKDWLFINKVALVLGLIVLLFFIVTVQKACDSRREGIENERLKTIEDQVADKLKIQQTYIEAANRDHETTLSILDSMVQVTAEINALKETDRVMGEHLQKVAPEYNAARNQRNNQTAIATGKAAASSNKKSINQREADAMKADRELYPGN